MIHIKNLNKTYEFNNQKVDIFTDMDFSVKKGEFISIIGPSGSGKTTLLNILSGIDDVYEGKVELAGQNIGEFTPEQMTDFRGKNISYIFQDFKLIDNLTVEENIDLVISINNLKRNFETQEIIDLVGLKGKEHKYIFHLSGGEAQRVAIARAFVGVTPVLLADEPTGSLDVKNKQTIMNLILNLHKKTKNTIIMITHDDEVARVCDKTYKIADYKLI